MKCGMIKRATIDEIVANRDRAISMAERAATMMADALSLMCEADRVREQSFITKVVDGDKAAEYGLGVYTDQDRDSDYRRLFSAINIEASLKAWKAHTDARTWASLYSMMGLSALLTTAQKEQMRKELSGFDVPEVTVDVAHGTLENAMADAVHNWRQGLAEVFSALDRSFRSHDGFKVGRRIILTNAFDSWGSFRHYGGRRDMLADIERAFAILDGVDPRGVVGTMGRKIEEERRMDVERGRRQSSHDGPYMRVNCFINGNAHLWLTRPDLVERLNQEIAAFYGEVLADAMPAEKDIHDLKTSPTAMVLCRDLQFYPTPSAAARQLVDETGCLSYPGDGRSGGRSVRVLEPSAGEGALIQAMMERAKNYSEHATPRLTLNVDAYEVSPERAARCGLLRSTRRCTLNLSVREQNFLDVAPVEQYDLVLMNPPFSGTHWMTHVLHAFKFLKPGGMLRSILPISAEMGRTKAHREFQKWAKANQPVSWSRFRMFEDLPIGSFRESGTNINTVILTVVKPS